MTSNLALLCILSMVINDNMYTYSSEKIKLTISMSDSLFGTFLVTTSVRTPSSELMQLFSELYLSRGVDLPSHRLV